MAAAVPLQQAQPSFLAAVRSFCKLIYQIGNEETKAAAFVFENTACYMEFDKPKRLTLDEFVHGRKRKDGSRLSAGCNIKQRSHAAEALQRLEAREVMTVTVDDSDKARQRKYYALNLDCSSLGNTSQDDTPVHLSTVPYQGTPCSSLGNPVFPDKELCVPPVGNSIRVSASSKCLEQVPLVDTSIAPIGASVEVEEVKYPLQGHKLVAQAAQMLTPAMSPERQELEDDLTRNERWLEQAKKVDAPAKRINDLKRAVDDLKAKIAALPASSDSQVQDVPPSAALYEETAQEPLSLIRTRYQDEIDEQRAIVEDAKAYWQEQKAVFNDASGSKRRELMHDVLAAERAYDEALWRLQVFNLAVDLMEQGRSHVEAVKEAQERLAAQEDEPAQPEPAEEAASVLFPDDEPEPEKVPAATLYEVLGSLFYDMEHASPSDKKAVAVVAERVKKRGLTAEDVLARYRAWARKFDALKAKSIFHFEQNIAAVGVA